MWCSKLLSKSWLRTMVIILALSFLYIGVVYAAPKKKVVAQKKVGAERPAGKTISGEISYVTKKYVSIITSRDVASGSESEIGFWIDEETQTGWRRKLEDLNIGDTIQIQFDEVIQDYDEIKEDKTVERKSKVDRFEAKGLKFLKPKSSSLRSK